MNMNSPAWFEKDPESILFLNESLDYMSCNHIITLNIFNSSCSLCIITWNSLKYCLYFVVYRPLPNFPCSHMWTLLYIQCLDYRHRPLYVFVSLCRPQSWMTTAHPHLPPSWPPSPSCWLIKMTIRPGLTALSIASWSQSWRRSASLCLSTYRSKTKTRWDMHTYKQWGFEREYSSLTHINYSDGQVCL